MKNTTETVEIPKDLQDKLTSLKALAGVHNLITNSSYKPAQFGQVDASVTFITILHTEMIKDACNHPQSDLVPELVEYKARLQTETV